jgi:hypothetical protein
MGHESVPLSWIGVKVSRSHRKDKEIVDCWQSREWAISPRSEEISILNNLVSFQSENLPWLLFKSLFRAVAISPLSGR